MHRRVLIFIKKLVPIFIIFMKFIDISFPWKYLTNFSLKKRNHCFGIPFYEFIVILFMKPNPRQIFKRTK